MRKFAVLATGLVLAAGCGSASTPTQPPPRVRHAAATRSSPPAIERLVQIARARYAREAGGLSAHRKLDRAASDRRLTAALANGSDAALQAAAHYEQIGTHQHISCLRVLRGSRVLAHYGGNFCVRPAAKTLRDARGRALGTLEVSIQDVIGYVRYMHRNYPVEVVIRAPGRALGSSPGAARAHLPGSGLTALAGHRYAVRSFAETAMGPEPIRVWILTRA